MKMTAMFTAIILLISMTLFSSCSQKDTAAETSGNVQETAASPSVSDQAAPAESQEPEDQPTASASAEYFVFEEQTYTEESISIKYPQITGYSDAAKQDALNQIIADAATTGLDEMGEGTEYALAYEVTRAGPDVISIFFNGYFYMPGAAHPSLPLFAVTIDASSEQAVGLSDLVTVDSAFVELVRSGEFSSTGYDMTDEYRTSIEEYLADTDNEMLLSELSAAGTSIWADACYLTQDMLFVSISVPHVMGDHVEIGINFNDLAQVKTDNPVWEALGA